MALDTELIGLDNLPNVYIKTIDVSTQDYVSPTNNEVTKKSYFFSIGCCVYDNMNQNFLGQNYVGNRSYWHEHELLQKYMFTRACLVYGDPDYVARDVGDLTSGQLNLPEYIERMKNTVDVAGEYGDIFSRPFYTEVIQNFNDTTIQKAFLGEQGQQTGKVEFELQFDKIDFTQPHGGAEVHRMDIFLFVQNFIDIEALKNDFGLNLEYTTNQWYLGPLRAEKIMEGGVWNDEAFVFYKDESGTDAWPGAVHRQPTFGYMAGAQQSNVPQAVLINKKIENSKIKHQELMRYSSIVADVTTQGPNYASPTYRPASSFSATAPEEGENWAAAAAQAEAGDLSDPHNFWTGAEATQWYEDWIVQKQIEHAMNNQSEEKE